MNKQGNAKLPEEIKIAILLSCKMYNPRDPTQWNLTRKLNVTRIESIVKLDKKLGEGSFGVVYRGKMLTNGKVVAVKEQSVSANAPLIQSEIEALYYVMQNGCGTYAIEVYDIIYDSRLQRVYIIMEYMPGGDLDNYIRKRAQPRDETDPSLVMLCRVLYNGVNCIHNADMAHRDIKPANVLFNADGQPKLSDFGLSCIQRCYFDGGTEVYMAPDIRYAGGQPISMLQWKSGDVWAAGCTLYEFITHRLYAETAGGLGYVSQKLFPNVLKLLQAAFERDPTARLKRWRALTNTLGALTAPIIPRAAVTKPVTQPIKQPTKPAQQAKQAKPAEPLRPTPFRVQEGPLPIALAKRINRIPPPPLQPEPLNEQPKAPKAQPEAEQPVYDFVFGPVENNPPIEVVKTPAKQQVKRVLDQSPQRVVVTKQQKRAITGKAQRVPVFQTLAVLSPEFQPEPMELESPRASFVQPMDIDTDDKADLFSFR